MSLNGSFVMSANYLDNHISNGSGIAPSSDQHANIMDRALYIKTYTEKY